MNVERSFHKLRWPDTVEVHTNDEGKKALVFIFSRSNSRPFDYQQTEFAHVLREFGHEVLVRVSGLADISLEEFELHGVYSTRFSQTVQNRQGLYNKSSELRQLEAELNTIPQDDPTYYHKAMRVRHLRTMLSTAEAQPTLKQLRESDEKLKNLELLAQAQEGIPRLRELTDDQLERLPIREAVKWHNESDPNHNPRLWNRWEVIQTKKYLRQHQAELSLQPDNLELRSRIIELEQKIAQLTEDKSV